MNETARELADLQRLLDSSSAAGGQRHLTGIVTPSRRLSAERLCADMGGVLVLNVATVSGSGAPRLSAVDGHFLHGQWYFSTAATSVKARHLSARPEISVGYTPRDGYGVWAHGVATRLVGVERDRIDAYLSEVYGQPLSGMADEIVIFRVDAHWMISYAMPDDEQAAMDAALPERDRRMANALAALG